MAFGARRPSGRVCFGHSKVPRRQAKPDHLMCHEKKGPRPHATRERKPPHSQEATENHSMGGREPDGPPLRDQAKPDHLMCHEKKDPRPHATREREPPHSQEATENHSIGGREPNGPPLRKPRRVEGVPLTRHGHS